MLIGKQNSGGDNFGLSHTKVGTGIDSPLVGTGIDSPLFGTGIDSPSVGTGIDSPSVGSVIDSPSVGSGIDSPPICLSESSFACSRLVSIVCVRNVCRQVGVPTGPQWLQAWCTY